MDGQLLRCYLLELPIELREQIYETVFALDGQRTSDRLDPLSLAREPNITRVSEAVRSETLPVYYGMRVLDVYTLVKCDSNSIVWLTTRKWYHNIPNRIRLVRTLVLRFAFVERYFGEPVEVQFMIRLNKGENSFTMKHSFAHGWWSDAHRKGDPADCEEVVQAIRGHIMSTLTAAIGDHGVGNLTCEDIDCMAAVDPKKLPI
ncbi:hypothetical protein BAUCODRAFT_146200 [Baudoinia panamericana UAMH 10762]|uniref:F-box domain-containing protein n=1 Tax=Baudoinia panamericana (strain UAMH 10762) TaxID=717646 RepID=M2NIK1_BAUPA|nr:uncharacterized protein BAUCODRAFT_146200 [Baudoinia panamericana UAMH 10762]EMC99229.1 hypothetical protein BAUCODRAFT_146200 [Baudoinia panamericana UAMH 10762]